MTEKIILELIGAMVLLILVIWRLIPFIGQRAVNNRMDSWVKEFQKNELKHLLNRLGDLPEKVGRLEERMNGIERSVDALWDRLNDHINRKA